jgi:predicted amidohydrolase YtcJ
MDGIVSMSSALLRDPYPDLPGTHGVQVTPSETLAAVARSCARSDWSLGVHLIGGAAIDRALEVFAEVDREVAIGNRRFSLIHAYLWPSAENISTAARLGVVAAVQAPMQEWIAPKLIARWGIDDAARATPMRSWLDGGVVLGGGSDSPLTPPDPLRGIAHSVTREVRGHGVVGPAQRITAGEALHSYTSAGAFLSFAEHERGTLRAGMLADWAALDVDPLQCRPDELGDATVSATCVGGAIVHARD